MSIERSVSGGPPMDRERRRISSEPVETKPGSAGGRPLLGMLLGRGLSRLAGWVAPVGRFSLYVGLLLVALTELRLPGGEGSIADVFLFVSIVCAFLVLAQGHILKIGLLKTHAIGLTLLISGVVIGTLAESSDDLQSLQRLGKFLFATTATIVACMVLLERRSQLRIALGCWVVSAAVTSVAALLQAALGDPLIGDEPLRGRMIGLSVNPNGLGAVAGMAIAGGLSLAAVSDRLRSILWLIATLLCITGVIVSASRAGAIVAIVSLAIWGLMFYGLKREFTALVLGCCLAGAAVALFLQVQVWSGLDPTERLASAADPYADSSLADRLHQYEDTLREALRNPLVGVGLADDDVTIRATEVHNTFLMLFRAGGLLSVLGIFIIFGDFLRKGIDAYLHSRSNTYKAFAVGLLAGTFGLFLDGMAGPVLYQREVWVPAALLLGLCVLTRRNRTTRPLAPAFESARRERSIRHHAKRTRGRRRAGD